jgi:two-component system, cell cycle response regulator
VLNPVDLARLARVWYRHPSVDPLVSVFVKLRRALRGALMLLLVSLLGAMVVAHATVHFDERLFAALIVASLAVIAATAWRRRRAETPRTLRDVELGALLAVAAYATVVHVDGGLDGRFYPVVYVAVGVLSAFARPAAACAVIVLIMGYEAVLRAVAFGHVDMQKLLPHFGFAMVFGVLNTLSLRLEMARLRKASKSELEADKERIKEEARSYRLLRAPRDGDDEDRLIRSGVEEIGMSVLLSLRLLRAALGAHTVLLLWLDERGARLRIAELDCDDDSEIAEGPFSARDGILGAVLTQRASVCLVQLKPRHALPYYRDVCPVQAVCAVPVFEHGAMRGVLVVDRAEPNPFTADEQRLVEQAARFASRSVENERVFAELERTKVEQGKLYRAAEALGAAGSEQEVVDAGVSSAREITAVDFAAFTSLEDGGRTHMIRAVSCELSSQLRGQRFEHNNGLVSMAVHNKHPLPYRGEYDPTRQVVFDRRLRPPPMPSLLVLPLVVGDEPLGTLVLGSHTRRAFHDAARSLLEVLASHMALSLSNARMLKRLEEQATTDGLTGLLNKRALLETAGEKLSAARRFGRQVSVLVADIDLFKRVNDGYGHDVGDVVIKALADIHQRNKRTTDSVARFGGEEFVTICEETDAEGALLLAERIRADLAATVFHGSNGEELRCTCSVGIATFPDAGESWPELFKAADEALYVSKRNGRDRATIYDQRRPSAA